MEHGEQARGRTRIHVLVSGRVQGVGFRFATCDTATRLGLGGWVRNLSDGRVEAVFEGPAAEVAQAVAWCRRGPAGASVSNVQTWPDQPVGENGFRARPSASAAEAT
jgi:acylphosphatase